MCMFVSVLYIYSKVLVKATFVLFTLWQFLRCHVGTFMQIIDKETVLRDICKR